MQGITFLKINFVCFYNIVGRIPLFLGRHFQ